MATSLPPPPQLPPNILLLPSAPHPRPRPPHPADVVQAASARLSAVVLILSVDARRPSAPTAGSFPLPVFGAKCLQSHWDKPGTQILSK